MSGDTTIIGAGWIGRHLATSLGVTAIPQREAIDVVPPSGGSLVIAGGRSSVAAGDDLSAVVEEECSALSAILDRAHQVGCRVVVLGSSDVCGSAEVITGSTPVDPLTHYARLKAARERVVIDAIEGGLNGVVARVAPGTWARQSADRSPRPIGTTESDRGAWRGRPFGWFHHVG